jgi:hypothetical protein
MNLAAHWQQIRELQSELPETVYLVDVRTGRISKSTDRSAAARLLVTYSYIRQASDPEAAKYEAREARRAELDAAVKTLEFKGLQIKVR